MRAVEVIRPWSFKTKNGRWSIRPGEQALVPTEVAIAAEAQAVLRAPEINPQQKGGEDNAPYPCDHLMAVAAILTAAAGLVWAFRRKE